jgi:anion-transporting  ArsA/GET3 family ATPase
VFFTEFNDILGGFRQRAEETFGLLRQPRVGFVLVASPEPMAVREALAFHERLTAAGMPFVGFVVNKVHPPRPLPPGAPPLEVALAAHPGIAALGLSATTHRMAAHAFAAAHGELETLAAADQQAVARMRAAGGESALLVQVPLLRDDVHDVDRLVGLERYLFA